MKCCFNLKAFFAFRFLVLCVMNQSKSPSPCVARHKSAKRWKTFSFTSATFTVNKTLRDLAK